jgi:hypothetical protein
MELSEASLNPRQGERLARLGVLRELLLARGPGAGPGRRGLRRRQGVLVGAVGDVLELAGAPLRVREVHAAVEELLGERVPFSSVNEALLTHVTGPGARFRRVGYGTYERLPQVIGATGEDDHGSRPGDL